jgi:hypothetical protein
LDSTVGQLTPKAAPDKPFEGIMPPVLETEVLARAFENYCAHVEDSQSRIREFTSLTSGGKMKNVEGVLKEKEVELTVLRKEVEALRVVAPLLVEEGETRPKMPPQSAAEASKTNTYPRAV